MEVENIVYEPTRGKSYHVVERLKYIVVESVARVGSPRKSKGNNIVGVSIRKWVNCSVV